MKKSVKFKTKLTDAQIDACRAAFGHRATLDIYVPEHFTGETEYVITLAIGEMTNEIALQFGIIIGAIQVGE